MRMINWNYFVENYNQETTAEAKGFISVILSLSYAQKVMQASELEIKVDQNVCIYIYMLQYRSLLEFGATKTYS